MSKAKETKIVGVLDANNVLVDKKVVAANVDGIDFGDLPTNGTFKYDDNAKTFIPIGHGFGKVSGFSPYEGDYIMRRIIEALDAAKLPGFEMPFEAAEWAKWYDGKLRRRHEELATRQR